MTTIAVNPNTERRLQQLTARTGKTPAEILDEALVCYAEQLPADTEPTLETDEQRRVRLAQALEQASALNPFRDIDPITWQREQRRDTPLPGRDREC